MDAFEDLLNKNKTASLDNWLEAITEQITTRVEEYESAVDILIESNQNRPSPYDHHKLKDLPKDGSHWHRASRYLHSVSSRQKNRISHMDGAIRIYSKQEIKERNSTHVRKIGKIGNRVKIFQIDYDIDI